MIGVNRVLKASEISDISLPPKYAAAAGLSRDELKTWEPAAARRGRRR